MGCVFEPFLSSEAGKGLVNLRPRLGVRVTECNAVVVFPFPPTPRQSPEPWVRLRNRRSLIRLGLVSLQISGQPVGLSPMRFIWAIVVYLLIGLVLGVGILHAVHGSYWLLIAGAVVYLLLFVRFGCAHH